MKASRAVTYSESADANQRSGMKESGLGQK